MIFYSHSNHTIWTASGPNNPNGHFVTIYSDLSMKFSAGSTERNHTYICQKPMDYGCVTSGGGEPYIDWWIHSWRVKHRSCTDTLFIDWSAEMLIVNTMCWKYPALILSFTHTQKIVLKGTRIVLLSFSWLMSSGSFELSQFVDKLAFQAEAMTTRFLRQIKSSQRFIKVNWRPIPVENREIHPAAVFLHPQL